MQMADTEEKSNKYTNYFKQMMAIKLMHTAPEAQW
jgi:hypothetical protein